MNNWKGDQPVSILSFESSWWFTFRILCKGIQSRQWFWRNSDIRGPQFESSHWQFYFLSTILDKLKMKVENKAKRGRELPNYFQRYLIRGLIPKANVIHKFWHCLTLLCRNKAVELVTTSHVTLHNNYYLLIKLWKGIFKKFQNRTPNLCNYLVTFNIKIPTCLFICLKIFLFLKGCLFVDT